MFLILSLSSCLTSVQTTYLIKRPPSTLTDQRDIPSLQGNTVKDLQLYTFDLIGEIEKSNLDKSKILDWFDKVEQELNK